LAYIDSNIFIYPVIYRADNLEKARNAREMLLRIERGDLKGYTSTLTWDEVVWVVGRTLGREDGVNQGKKLLGFPNLEFIDVDKRVLGSAQMFMDKYKINPRDSIHVASAVVKNLRVMVSDDDDFDRIKEIERTPLI